MRYINITNYDEFSPNRGYPSLRTQCREDRMPHADIIIDKLLSGECLLVSPCFLSDCFTGERLPMGRIILHDDKYSWETSIAYYIDKHNLHLPDEIAKHFLEES